jgi:Fe2+ transport system protein FeoA
LSRPPDLSSTLDRLAPGAAATVVAVTGGDALAARLEASGLWPGARVEWLARAPFGGPLLVRVHGFRLALRADEAARVQVQGGAA